MITLKYIVLKLYIYINNIYIYNQTLLNTTSYFSSSHERIILFKDTTFPQYMYQNFKKPPTTTKPYAEPSSCSPRPPPALSQQQPGTLPPSFSKPQSCHGSSATESTVPSLHELTLGRDYLRSYPHNYFNYILLGAGTGKNHHARRLFPLFSF